MMHAHANTQSTDVVEYRSIDGVVSLCVPIDDETVWATQAQMSELFGVDQRTVSLHLNNALKEGEITKESSYQESWYQVEGGQRRRRVIYNLDAIITVGYRVKSRRGTEFRIWATRQLRDRLLLRAAPSNDNDAELAALRKEMLALQSEVALLHGGCMSAAHHRQMQADIARITGYEVASGRFKTRNAARWAIYRELRETTGWGGRAQPWRLAPAELVHPIGVVLRRRDMAIQRELKLLADDRQLRLPDVPVEPEPESKKPTTH